MAGAGLWMLALVAVVMIATGLPAFVALIGVAVLFAIIGIATGALPYALFTALPPRVLGLLENDLLQALPLYVLMGALLNRLPLADILFRAGNALFARTPAAPLLSALGVGARGWLAAGATFVLILGLLSAVTAGYLYAVEAAAAGAVALFAFGLATRALTPPVLALVLRNTMAVTG